MLLLGASWALATAALWYGHRQGHLARDYHKDALALGALALATAGFFWRLLFTSNVWMPVGGGDLASFLYPVYRYTARQVAAGALPLWNPYLYGGAPFAGDNQTGLFYPINLVYYLLRPGLDYRAMELLAVAHFYLAGACAYLGLRYIGRKPLRRGAALSGAAAFMFSDLFVTHFGNLNMIASAAWLPLIFCLFRRALDEKRAAAAVGAGILLGMSALAGHAQPLLFSLLALGLYSVHYAYQRRMCGLRDLLHAFLLASLALMVAFGVAAPALLPNLEMSGLTLRAELTYEQASEYSLPPVALVGLLVPGVFGRGPRGFRGSWPRVEVGYVGILTLLFAGLGVALRRDSLSRFFALLAIVSLLLALGDATVLHRWLYRFVPGFNLVRAPARFVFLMDFALAGLAALGLDSLMRPIGHYARGAWRRVLQSSPFVVCSAALVLLPLGYISLVGGPDRPPEVRVRLLNAFGGAAFALLLLGLGIVLLRARRNGTIKWSTIGLVVFCLTVFDLSVHGAHTELEFNNPTAGFDHPAAIAFLKSDPEYYRIDTRTGVWDVWQPDLSLMHDIFDVWGIYNPLVLANFDRYWEGLGSRSTPLYDFLNAKYIVGHKDVVLDWEKFEIAFDADPQVNIYENTRVMPRAFVVHEAWAVPDSEAAFAAIHLPEFNPSTMVIIEGKVALVPQTGASSQTSIVSYSSGQIELMVSTTAPGYLVMSEVYYPGWKVAVDSIPAALERANYAFRAVYVPAGTHRVRFYFDSVLCKAGIACAALTWGMIALAGLRALLYRWRRRAQPAMT